MNLLGAAPMLDYSSNPESPITPKDPHFPSRMSSDSPKLEKKNSNLQPSKIYASDDNELTSDDEGEEKLSAVGIDTVPKEGVIKQGYLLKQTLVRKKWKKRWVVLREGGKLTYYKNEEVFSIFFNFNFLLYFFFFFSKFKRKPKTKQKTFIGI